MDNIIEALKPLAVDISSVKQDPRNARKHNKRNLDAIKTSLQAYGQRKPIVVNSDGTIEAGNALWQAAKELGWDKIAVTRVDDSKEIAAAYGIMDNKSADLSEFDLPTLKDILQELDTGAFNMEWTGFEDKEIEELMTQFHIPETEPEFDENIETKNKCPKCGYEW
ncbi:MAG: ParB N-terminal domain-containing protein [Methanofastidiosum sp.]